MIYLPTNKMFKYINNQLYGKHNHKNTSVSLGGFGREESSVEVTDDCLAINTDDIAAHVDKHDKGNARRSYKHCSNGMLLFFIINLLPTVAASGGYQLQWRGMVIYQGYKDGTTDSQFNFIVLTQYLQNQFYLKKIASI